MNKKASRSRAEKLGLREILGEDWDNWPRPIRQRFRRTAARFKKYGLKPKQIAQELCWREHELMSANYWDARFEIANKNFAVLKILDKIEELAQGKTWRVESLSRVARFVFDINGLKTINDLAGHQAGDKLLQRGVKVFQAGATTQWLKKNFKLEVFPAAEGGDEFSLLVSGKEDLRQMVTNPLTGEKQELLQAALENYWQEIREIKLDDLVDFERAEMREKLDGAAVPKDFKFMATTSGGYGLLSEAWEKLGGGSGKSGKPDEARIGGLAAEFMDLADQRMLENKVEFKKFLSQNSDPRLRFLSMLYQRSREYWSLAKENARLKRRLTIYRDIWHKLDKKG